MGKWSPFNFSANLFIFPLTRKDWGVAGKTAATEEEEEEEKLVENDGRKRKLSVKKDRFDSLQTFRCFDNKFRVQLLVKMCRTISAGV
ncbi:hypothetical protein RUM43_010020, partial [Polyplax serrata]